LFVPAHVKLQNAAKAVKKVPKFRLCPRRFRPLWSVGAYEQTPDLFFEFRPRLIVLVLNDPHSALTREPVPHVGHVLQSLSLFRRFHLSR
jgi:hypothetical protein